MTKKIKLPPVGMRVIKSAIGVFLGFVIYELRGRTGIPFYTALSVLWCIRPYKGDTMTMALEIVSDQLAEVGIRAEIKNYDESTWLETRKSGELGSFMSTWSADYNDPDNFIYTFFGNEEKTRIRSINYPDTEVMERVAKARTIVNEDERLAEYKALEEKLIHEDAAWVPMFSRLHLFAMSKRVQGFAPLWSGLSDQLFYNISLSE